MVISAIQISGLSWFKIILLFIAFLCTLSSVLHKVEAKVINLEQATVTENNKPNPIMVNNSVNVEEDDDEEEYNELDEANKGDDDGDYELEDDEDENEEDEEEDINNTIDTCEKLISEKKEIKKSELLENSRNKIRQKQQEKKTATKKRKSPKKEKTENITEKNKQDEYTGRFIDLE